ncbi:MAG: dTDP-4-dehydrorhamnose reductase [Shewanella sp. CG18_big_fil_WC_8_21_14_2_50_42_11]|uniref:dTDP-4-dehydrorhamnose reductase n=1 Tax=Shewanella sp. CG18_big_fil_WC_8_21_14_2_50_42_11 TaxID=1975538 RepID=UPI000C3E7970|nr:dTDP-4-dehydrorhamnose reductase [Shewanella sp. CG18_big_fil_WC_8_21_14_2_50_42_11]NCO14573.1 dTDP-4-dehydrorhamnose reductase [Thiomicrospira sp.]PIQ00586.1 MAG: dTDP-4-dehydrorhamnose reductase [Shewanella sp. CG18_big_fil_WC_8_21_14_2_50_42_11]
MNKRVLVTGKNGQFGQSLQKIAGDYPKFDFRFVGREELDLVSSASIVAFFADKKFDAIINCAAYTAVDKAESEPELADQINHIAVKQLAHIAKEMDAILIHISTDYVFDGTNHKPYVETDPTNPRNMYGVTKLKGEQAMLAINPRGAIIRTSWVYSEFGNNFVKAMLRLGQERDSLNIISDQVGSPTYATDLAEACITVITSNNNDMEIYHYSNEGVCSWYDFAKAIFQIAKINCYPNPIETKDYPTPAQRPHYSLLNKAKIKSVYSDLEIPHWQTSLKKMLHFDLVLEVG